MELPHRELAETALQQVVKWYRGKPTVFADGLGRDMLKEMTVFAWPMRSRRRLRTSNPIELCVQQEVKRRTRSIRVFSNDAFLLMVASAIMKEIDEKWISETMPYIRWENKMTDRHSYEFPDIRAHNPENRVGRHNDHSGANDGC